MHKNGRYFLGRIVKIGHFTQEMLLKAMRAPVTKVAGKYGWTITHFQEFKEEGAHHFVFGHLTKFQPDATVSVIDPHNRREEERDEPNLRVAASPFVYIPEYSGIAYLHVWNQIEQPTFIKRFSDIVTETYEKFFVDCSIEALSDLRSFAHKLANLDGVYEMWARVYPPNPLFGPLWKPLKDYVERRNAQELKVEEKSPGDTPINTEISNHIKGILEQDKQKPYVPKEEVAITDAAILMAADGYGRGKIVGKKENQLVVIRTSETLKSFLFEKEPAPLELYEQAVRHFKKVSDERQMQH